ncbi:MAG TPA: TetR/AcrR family transcriptional regulator [Solirubrobacteraceae bacterium]|nr:TetR/AcrR family transcriptional regulator [Solirubrobacteraceae bacterium]
MVAKAGTARDPSLDARGRPTPHASAREGVLHEQRLRLIAAMIDSVGEKGYRRTSVADVLTRAEVSRKAFYKHFPNKRECFLAAYDLISAHAIRRVERALRGAEGWPARAHAAIAALLEAAIENPGALRVAVIEIGALGAAGIERRERTASAYERLVRDAVEISPGKGGISDAAARAVVGGISSVLHSRVPSGERSALLKLVPDLVNWAASYHPTPPSLARGLQSSRDAAGFSLLGGRAPGTLAPHARLDKKRRGLPRGAQNVSHRFVAHSQCERILDAVANLAADQGYAALQVDDIADEAAVSLNAFYEQFTDKEEAFLAAYELGHANCLAVVERAYASQPDWREGVRAGISALLHFLAAEPAFARIALVDSIAATARTADRSNTGVSAYAKVLFPGLEIPENARPPAVVGEAVAGGVLELCLHHIFQGRVRELPDLIGNATFVVLAPFIGAKEAERVANAPAASSAPPRASPRRGSSAAARRS